MPVENIRQLPIGLFHIPLQRLHRRIAAQSLFPFVGIHLFFGGNDDHPEFAARCHNLRLQFGNQGIHQLPCRLPIGVHRGLIHKKWHGNIGGGGADARFAAEQPAGSQRVQHGGNIRQMRRQPAIERAVQKEPIRNGEHRRGGERFRFFQPQRLVCGSGVKRRGIHQRAVFIQPEITFLHTAAVAGNFQRGVTVGGVVAHKKEKQGDIRVEFHPFLPEHQQFLVGAVTAHAGVDGLRGNTGICQPLLGLFEKSICQRHLQRLAERVCQHQQTQFARRNIIIGQRRVIAQTERVNLHIGLVFVVTAVKNAAAVRLVFPAQNRVGLPDVGVRHGGRRHTQHPNHNFQCQNRQDCAHQRQQYFPQKRKQTFH